MLMEAGRRILELRCAILPTNELAATSSFVTEMKASKSHLDEEGKRLAQFAHMGRVSSHYNVQIVSTFLPNS